MISKMVIKEISILIKKMKYGTIMFDDLQKEGEDILSIVELV
jgi:hypothetical protein